MTKRDPGWLRTYWKWFTATLLAVFVVGFGIPEIVGIANPGVGGTYTESIQDWTGIPEGAVTGGWIGITMLLAGLAVWFPVHLQGWWPWEKDPGEGVGS